MELKSCPTLHLTHIGAASPLISGNFVELFNSLSVRNPFLYLSLSNFRIVTFHGYLMFPLCLCQMRTDDYYWDMSWNDVDCKVENHYVCKTSSSKLSLFLSFCCDALDDVQVMYRKMMVMM